MVFLRFEGSGDDFLDVLLIYIYTLLEGGMKGCQSVKLHKCFAFRRLGFTLDRRFLDAFGRSSSSIALKGFKSTHSWCRNIVLLSFTIIDESMPNNHSVFSF